MEGKKWNWGFLPGNAQILTDLKKLRCFIDQQNPSFPKMSMNCRIDPVISDFSYPTFDRAKKALENGQIHILQLKSDSLL